MSHTEVVDGISSVSGIFEFDKAKASHNFDISDRAEAFQEMFDIPFVTSG